jgi:hypothetical protein
MSMFTGDVKITIRHKGHNDYDYYNNMFNIDHGRFSYKGKGDIYVYYNY